MGYGTTIASNLAGWTRNHHDHDEADTLIICVAREIARLNQSKEDFSVKILSSDTDVLMLPNNSVVHSSRCYLIFELLSGKISSSELDP